MGTKYRDGVSYHGAFPAQVIQELVQDLCDMVYPIGCYFETTDTDFNPNDVFVGTWVLEAEGLVHVSSGTNYVVSTDAQDGGEATHTLQKTEMPAHNHGFQMAGTNLDPSGDGAFGFQSNVNAGSGAFWVTGLCRKGDAGNYAGSMRNTGGGQAHNNMQPYKIVNRWYRTE